METIARSTDGPPMLAARLNPGAVIVQRDGRSVPAYYSSAAAELAVCRKSVGLAVRPDLDAFNVFGHPAWLERLLAKGLGDRVPEVGRAQSMAGSWCARVGVEDALVVAPPAAAQRWRRMTRDAITTGDPVATTDMRSVQVVISLIGPLLGKLLGTAGLPGGTGAGSVAVGTLAGAPAVLLREDSDRVLLVLPADRAEDCCSALLNAGRLLGLSLVGVDAVIRLGAAGRPA